MLRLRSLLTMQKCILREVSAHVTSYNVLYKYLQYLAYLCVSFSVSAHVI